MNSVARLRFTLKPYINISQVLVQLLFMLIFKLNIIFEIIKIKPDLEVYYHDAVMQNDKKLIGLVQYLWLADMALPGHGWLNYDPLSRLSQIFQESMDHIIGASLSEPLQLALQSRSGACVNVCVSTYVCVTVRHSVKALYQRNKFEMHTDVQSYKKGSVQCTDSRFIKNSTIEPTVTCTPRNNYNHVYCNYEDTV